MVAGISTTDPKKSSFADFKKSQPANYQPAKTKPIPQDKVVISTKPTTKKSSMSKLQVASLVVGSLASITLMAYFGKMLLPIGKNKKLLERIKNADLPDGVRGKLLDEYESFRRSFVDTDNSQNYIEHALRLPFAKPKRQIVDIDRAREILDESHVGLDRVKNEVIGFLRRQNYNIRNGIKQDGPLIICLDGPPGVGKTSIASSIARAMGKPFERISLAGISNAPDLVGHNRAYKGSAPGKISRALQRAKQSDPVILLDEIDKMGSSREHGSPASVLLDVLEPEQCRHFRDGFLDFEFDLSNATFVITSNDIRKIPPELRDRLSIIHIPGYSAEEKLGICKFALTKMMKKLKIDETSARFTDEGLHEIVARANDQGARATVRHLKKVLDTVIETLETRPQEKPITVDRDFVTKALKNFEET